MPSMCTQLAARTGRLAQAQRAFWDAWKAVSAGDRTQRIRAKEARAQLESIHREISGLMYHLWAPRVRERAEVASSYHHRFSIQSGSAPWNIRTIRWLDQDDLVVTGGDVNVQIVRPRGSRQQDVPLEHKSMVRNASVTADGRIVAIEIDRITVWENIHGRHRVQEEMFLDGANFLDAYIMQDETIVAADVSQRADGRIYVSHKNDDGSREWMTLLGHRGGVLTVHPLPDGRILSGGFDGSLRVWDVNREDYTVESYGNEDRSKILRIHSNAHGRIAAIDPFGCTTWQVREDGHLEHVADFHVPGRMEDVMVLPNGNVVLCNDMGDVYVCRQDANDLYTCEELVLGDEKTQLCSIDMAEDGRIVIGTGGRIKIFEAKND